MPDPATLLFLIPIVAIVMGTGTGMIAIYFNYKKRKELFALYHQERMAAIEKGIDLPALPEDFFQDDHSPNHAAQSRGGSHATLFLGLLFTFIGVGLFIALFFAPRTDMEERGRIDCFFGLLCGGISLAAAGVACLIYYVAVGRRRALLAEEERKTELELKIKN